MVEAIKTKVIEIDFDEIDIKQIVAIHPDAKYVIICGEIEEDRAEELSITLSEWYSDLENPIGILFGDYMLVRIDRLPPHVADSLGMSI